MCTPYKIERNDLFGRYIVAARNLKQGEIIIQEKATAVGPQINATPICFRCCSIINQKRVYICQVCNKALLCTPHCKGAFHPEQECESLRNCSLRPEHFLNNPQIIMPARCILLRDHAPATWEDFMKLEPHLEARRDTDIWRMHQVHTGDVLRKLGFLGEEQDEDFVQRVCGILDVNSFELRPSNCERNVDPSLCLRGVFLISSLLAHDCVGNVHLSVDDDCIMTIRASVDIPENDTVYFNYTNGLQGTYERRAHLKEGKYFDCCCKRCADNTEMNTNMSAVRCKKCTDGLFLSTNPLGGTYTEPWKCNKCGSLLKGVEVETTINACKEKIKEFSNVNQAEKLLEKLSLTLPANHALIIELKQNILSLPRISSERKIELYKDLLAVVNVVEPGISRYRSIIKYEYHNALVEMTTRKYNKNELKTDDFLKHMRYAETLLTEAIKLLLYEPKSTPEGRLAQKAMTDLKVLRGTISDVGKILLLEPKNKRDNRKKK